MGKYQKMARGVEHLAKGIYSQMDDQAAKKFNKTMTKKAIGSMTSSNAYKAGVSISKATPFKGIMDSTREYYKHSNAGQTGMSTVKNAIIQGHKNANGKADFGKIAGTAVTIGVAGRVATGGGLYRDRYGNVNIPGLPFI